LVSYSDLLKVFKAKAANGKCPWCEANDWKGFGSDQYGAVLLADSEGVSKREGFEAFIVACQNCGYVNFT
jgi:hypothetical protein